jgi:hypothetical protein
MQIQDLSKELDTKELSAVRGGNNGNAATNTIGQAMALSVPVAVGVAGPANTNVDVTGTQTAYLDNVQIAGDSFLVVPFFPGLRAPC